MLRFLKNFLFPKTSSKSSKSANDYKFVEVKPDHVLRVRHIIPDRPVTEEPTGQGWSVNCKRRITVFGNGLPFIYDVGYKRIAELKKFVQKNGFTEPNNSVKVELTDCGDSSPPVSLPEAKYESPTAVVEETQERGAGGEATAAPQAEQSQQPKLWMWNISKPKRSVLINCERKISSCKGTHPDVVLFFIHGVGGSLDIWERQLDYFSNEGYEVIAVDLAGHGCSSAPQIAAAYSFYALAEDMRQIFKRYARKRNILIGHSYGVSLCTFLAHEYPDQVHKMVLINGGSPTALEPTTSSSFNLPKRAHHSLSWLNKRRFFRAAFAEHTSREWKLLRDHNAFNVSPFVLRAMMKGQYWPEGDDLYHAQLTMPVLVLHGMQNKLVPIEDDEEMANVLLLGFLRTISGTGHMVMLERPLAVNKLMHEFFVWEPAADPLPKK